MANKVNHRRNGQRRRSNESGERPVSCGGHGRNGAIGRSRWKRLSARKERRTGMNIPPVNPNRKASQWPFVRPCPDEE